MQHNLMIQLDDSLYQPLIEQVGKENINQFFAKLVEPYLLINDVKNNPVEKVDKTETLDKPTIKHHADSRVLDNAKKDNIEETFGMLTSKQGVSLEEMNQAIRKRGAGL